MELLTFTIICAYLVGAFPSGKALASLHGVDIATHGSGNVGATNVARTIGKKAGLITLSLDVIKGVLGVALVRSLLVDPVQQYSASVFIVAGHCFSLPPILKGGKGVAAALGVFIMLTPIAALAGITVFFLTFVATRIVSLSSIFAAFIVPIVVAYLYEAPNLWIASTVISAVIILRHYQNIARLSKGEESQFMVR